VRPILGLVRSVSSRCQALNQDCVSLSTDVRPVTEPYRATRHVHGIRSVSGQSVPGTVFAGSALAAVSRGEM